MLLDELLDVAEKENVHISYDGLNRPGVRLQGLYFVDPQRQQGMIILDTALKNDPLKHAVVLAEELGHHFAGVNTCFVPLRRKQFFKTKSTHSERHFRLLRGLLAASR